MNVKWAFVAFSLLALILAQWGDIRSRGPSGSAAAGTEVSQAGDLSGRWEALAQVPVAAWSAALLPTGKVLLFQNGSQMYLWDPKTRRFGHRFRSNTNLFCAGLALLGDGRLLAVGGHEGKDPQGHFLGVKSAEVFDPWTERWRRLPDMAGGERWYPSAITLADGRVLVASGTHAGEQNETIEIFDPITQNWEVIARQRLPQYPRVAVLPDGNLIFYGPQRQTGILDLEGGTFKQIGAMSVARPGGAGVLLEAETGKLLALGGGEPVTNSVEIFDPARGYWEQTDPMAHPRHHPDAVLLPDGRVLVIGGHSGAHGHDHGGEAGDAAGDVLMAELFDPEEGRWLEAGEAHYGHGYHSTALLLPDGSVLAAGPERTLEIYYPWYFDEERPEITAMPNSTSYGESFSVETPMADEITRVVIIRLSSTTHSLNTDQRYLKLGFEQISESELRVEAPPSAALAPPGYYLLSLVTSEGVPSEGVFLRIGREDNE